MRILIPSLMLIVVTVLISSCASTSKAGDEKDAAAKEFSVPDDKGVVYFYRLNRAVGAAVATQIKINGLDAGGTGPGTYFRWELKPGTYVFTASSTESSAAVELDVKAGDMYFIRQDERLGLSSGRVTIKEVKEKEGKEAVNSCKLLVSSYVPAE